MDITYELHLLRRRFPGIPLWFGHATRHYWALVNDRLIEANTPLELADAIRSAKAGPVPPPDLRTARRAARSATARAYGRGNTTAVG